MSVAPPAGKGTIMLIGRAGQVCAAAAPAPANTVRAAAKPVNHLRMLSPESLFRRNRGRGTHLTEQPSIGKDLSDKPVEHIDQTNESDGSFLMRLARQYGAIASVKNGNLLFIRQGQGKSASGKPLPVITITRKDGDSHRFTLADRGAYTGVIASWLHTREPAKNESTTVKRKRRTKKQKKEPEAKQGDYLVGTDENVLVLNRTYANRSNAERAAKMQWERLQRGVASLSLQLAEGRADLYTEMPVKVSGFKQPIDDAEWTITTLTHTVSPDNGFTTSLELEVRIDDFEME